MYSVTPKFWVKLYLKMDLFFVHIIKPVWQVKQAQDRPGTVKSLAAPSKLKPSQQRKGSGRKLPLRLVQGVGPVRIQIDPSSPCVLNILPGAKSLINSNPHPLFHNVDMVVVHNKIPKQQYSVTSMGLGTQLCQDIQREPNQLELLT